MWLLYDIDSTNKCAKLKNSVGVVVEMEYIMDLKTIFSTNNRSKTVVKQGTAIVSNTMLIMDRLDVENFKACVYGYDKANNALYIKLTNNVDKSEKHSDIQKTLYVAKIRLNIAKGLGLEPKANKEVELEPVKDQKHTYKLQLA